MDVVVVIYGLGLVGVLLVGMVVVKVFVWVNKLFLIFVNYMVGYLMVVCDVKEF